MPALVNQDKAGEAEAEVPGQWVIYQAGSEGQNAKGWWCTLGYRGHGGEGRET